ncbi:cysteine-rich KTR domain-containing protein [Petralouisia muris]|uniref:cysteine-rich KTR domain-containing protein n=1 Tax=Petralouisia muris TaxID=3032872 RepID=UPI0038CDAEFF
MDAAYETKWIYCPICSNKTRTGIREPDVQHNLFVYGNVHALSVCQVCRIFSAGNRQNMSSMYGWRREFSANCS